MTNGYEIESGVTLRLPALVGTPLFSDASADDFRVLIALAEAEYAASVESLAHATGMTLTRTAAALEHWIDAGVLREKQAPEKAPYLPSDELPRGRAEDDARVIAEKRLRDCIETCSLILKKQLNPSEIGILVALVNDLGISEYYLTTLLTYCADTLDSRGIKFLEKTAVSLTDRGIRSDAALDEYITASELAHSHEGAVRRLYGMGARELTPGERECLIRWFSTYGYDMEVVGLAYDKTVASAGKVNIKYTDKILTDWHRQGLKTTSEIEDYLKRQAEEESARRGAKKRSGTKSAPAKAPVSFDTDSFFESALKRSYGSAADPAEKK